MKIVVVNNFFPPRPGGSSHLSSHLAKAYAAAGHEVLVLTASYGNSLRKEIKDGYKIVRLPSWNLPQNKLTANFDVGFTLSPAVIKKVFRTLDEFKPDVLHQHGQFFDLTWITGWWARKRKIPTLLSIHTRLESPLSKLNSFIYSVADHFLVAPLMRIHKPKLVVMDLLMDQYIDKRYKYSISGRFNIPVGIDPPVMRGGDKSRIIEEFGLSGKPVVLSIGHVIPIRSRIQLVKALPYLLEMHPDVKVVVVGGVYHDEFIHLAKQLNVQDSLIVTGARPSKDIPDFLAAADVEVHELDGCGFGTASLEALATGIPVVAAVSANNFIGLTMKDKEILFLTPFESQSRPSAEPKALAKVIGDVLDNPQLSRALVSKNAIDFIESNFTIELVAAQHLEALTQLAGADVV
jgi:glycosyltransferase involved in cell wall biosynthesis